MTLVYRFELGIFILYARVMTNREGHITRRNFLQGVGGSGLLIQSSLAVLPQYSALSKETQALGQNKKEQVGPVVSQEFKVEVDGHTIIPRLISPQPERLAAKPLLLLNLSTSREVSLTVHPYLLAANLFLKQGHRVLSFDLPNQGTRADKYGEGLVGWRNAFVDGKDPFTMFVKEASAVISWSIEAGLADPGRIVIYGISRSGYLALRLLAVDTRVAAVAAIAPVTDWGVLAEFAADRKREYLPKLNLSLYVEQLTGKPIFLVINNSDDRVSALTCSRFFLDLLEANVRKGRGTSKIEFISSAMAAPGHSVDDSWRQMGAEFLLKWHQS